MNRVEELLQRHPGACLLGAVGKSDDDQDRWKIYGDGADSFYDDFTNVVYPDRGTAQRVILQHAAKLEFPGDAVEFAGKYGGSSGGFWVFCMSVLLRSINEFEGNFPIKRMYQAFEKDRQRGRTKARTVPPLEWLSRTFFEEYSKYLVSIGVLREGSGVKPNHLKDEFWENLPHPAKYYLHALFIALG